MICHLSFSPSKPFIEAGFGNDRWLVTDAADPSSVSLLFRLAPIQKTGQDQSATTRKAHGYDEVVPSLRTTNPNTTKNYSGHSSKLFVCDMDTLHSTIVKRKVSIC